MSKRKQQTDDNFEDVIDQIKNACQPLFDDGGNDLVRQAILRFADDSGVTLESPQRPKNKNPSFSAAKWETVAPSLRLRGDLGILQFNVFTIPLVVLPPSFHRELMKNSSRWMDVYQEPEHHKREEARVRVLEAWYVPICSLFKGRLVDKPENPIPSTPETSGGEVEHKVFLFHNLILFIVEMKFSAPNSLDYYAQVLLELVSAIKLNRDRDFDPQPPVYAMLSDLSSFIFLSYDGTNFRRMAKIQVPLELRVDFMYGMAQDILFSLLLNGYIGILAAVEKRSMMRGEAGDSSEHSSFSSGKSLIKKPGRSSTRPSLDGWSKALLKARDAQTIFTKPNFTTEEMWEKDSLQGMAMLNESLRHLSKFGSVADWTEEESRLEIDGIMARLIKLYRSRAIENEPPCVTT